MFSYLQIKKFLIRCLLSIILFFIIAILLTNDNIYYKTHDILFKNNIDFSYIKSKTSSLIGKILGNKTSFVSSEKLEYEYLEKYNNSTKIKTGSNYVVKSIESGVVVYIGEKDDLGATIIILGDDEIHYWYSNVENISINMYDYVEVGTILGSTSDEFLILTLLKGEEYIYYEDTI